MKCPHCKRDIREAAVLQGAAAIVARRRRRAGNQITSEQARKIQALSAAARSENARRRAEDAENAENPAAKKGNE